MFTKKILGAAALAALAVASTGCIVNSDDSLDESNGATSDSVSATDVIATVGSAVGSLDAFAAAIASGNPLAAIAAVGSFAGIFAPTSNYVEVSPATIDQIASETAAKVVAQIDLTNMTTYLQHGKDDVTATRTLYSRTKCTPGKATSTLPHCVIASLQNSATLAVTQFQSLNGDWSDIVTLQKKSLGLAMMSAKTVMLVGAARMFLANEQQLITQLIAQTSKYNNLADKSTFKLALQKTSTTYRTELKTEATWLDGRFKPALDGLYNVHTCVVNDHQFRDTYGCVTDPANQEHRTSDYRDCENDWELGWLCDSSPSDATLISHATTLRDQLEQSISTSKRATWLGANFDTVRAKL
jgi:hypothetical protein